MAIRKLKKPEEGAKMPETADMVAWKEEFDTMKTKDHLAKLKALGLDDDDLEEFKEMEEGAPLEDELMSKGPLGKEEEPTNKKVAKKKVIKKKKTKK